MKTTGHNIKFDNIFLRQRLGIKNVATFDTMLAHGVLDENSKHGLKILAYEEFDMPDYEEALIKKYLGNRNDEYSKVPFDQLAKYCAWDCTTSHALRPIYQARLEKEGLMEWPYNRVLMPANEAFTVMTMRGLQVDIPYLKECHQYLLDEAERIRYKTGVMIGNPDINLNSPKQVAEVLWDFLKLPQFKSKRIKDRSTSEDAVMHLRGKHPFVDELQHYRRVAKFDSSYIQNMIEFADFDNRVHADVMLLGTEIGRLSMRDPAVQTIPRPTSKDDTLRDDYDPYMDGGLVRGAMVASPGCLLGIADYSQAELRVWGAMSHEPFLLQAYRDERDLHSEVALGMYGPNYTKEQRVMCKMFNFSYVYGGTERSFADSAGLPLSVAIEFVRNYNKLMPVAIQWKKDQFQLMRTQGYVETMFGRRRRFPLITPENQDDARKASVHQPVAGTASDLTTMAATRLILEHDIPVVLTVHDSILTDSPEALVEDHVNEIVAAMQDVGNQYISEVPWKVDKEIAYRWAEPPKLSRIVAASTSQERST
jgi:DNA polymerase-1